MRRVGWSRHGTGRGGGCARLVGGRQARGEGAGARGAWVVRGRSDGMGQGLVGAHPLGMARRQESPAAWQPASAARVEQGREREQSRERVERERERKTLNFLQNFELCSKKFDYESCSEFQDLQLLFLPFFYLRHRF